MLALAAYLRRLGLQQPAVIVLETFQPLAFLADAGWAALAPLWSADRAPQPPDLTAASARLLTELTQEEP